MTTQSINRSASERFATHLAGLGVPNAESLVEEWILRAGKRLLEDCQERQERGEVRNFAAYMTQALKNGSITPPPQPKEEPDFSPPNARTDFQDLAQRHDELLRQFPLEQELSVLRVLRQLEEQGTEVTISAVNLRLRGHLRSVA